MPRNGQQSLTECVGQRAVPARLDYSAFGRPERWPHCPRRDYRRCEEMRYIRAVAWCVLFAPAVFEPKAVDHNAYNEGDLKTLRDLSFIDHPVCEL